MGDEIAGAVAPGPPVLRPRPVAGSVDELLAGATSREPVQMSAEGKSGARFERVMIDGSPHILKHLHVDEDWVARSTGDLACRPLLAWGSGLLHAVPPSIDHTVVGCAHDGGRNGWGGAVLMRDVTGLMVPDGAEQIPLAQHRRFLEHLADLHATFWGWEDTVGLLPMGSRFGWLSPLTGEVEAALGATDEVPRMLAPGWAQVRAEAPAAGALVFSLFDDPSPVLRPLARMPHTLVHSDPKAGNLGSHPDGRTILVDWAFPGAAPALVDLGWYLAVNCDLLPETKEETIEAYGTALEARGIETRGWWEAHLALCLVGAFMLLGWGKHGPELAWWDRRLAAATAFLE